MKLSDFDYNLPKELIAQEPVEPRDHSRLLVLRRFSSPAGGGGTEGTRGCEIKDKYFYDIVDYFNKGDILVLNNSKVFPARLIGERQGTGGKVEVFLVRRGDGDATSRDLATQGLYGDNGETWQCLVGGHRRKEGLEVEFDGGLKARVIKNNGDGTFAVEFSKSGADLMKIVNKIGQVPLPPYIKRDSRDAINRVSTDVKNYQTVYADPEKTGSVAAPTAGLHFTPELIEKIKAKGVDIEYVTLHVGLGTFAPVKTDDIKEHKMHAEYVEIEKDTINRIIRAKKENRRIIAVGTTSVRTLESVIPGVKCQMSKVKGYSVWTDIFIYPGYEFKIVDAMITNFHLPKSTLLMLVSALAGKKNIDKAYAHAIKNKYRFYSYGDAMLIT